MPANFDAQFEATSAKISPEILESYRQLDDCLRAFVQYTGDLSAAVFPRSNRSPLNPVFNRSSRSIHSPVIPTPMAAVPTSTCTTRQSLTTSVFDPDTHSIRSPITTAPTATASIPLPALPAQMLPAKSAAVAPVAQRVDVDLQDGDVAGASKGDATKKRRRQKKKKGRRAHGVSKLVE